MRLFKKMAIIIGLITTAIIVGDFLNLPLWPVDRFKTRVPVEITFKTDSIPKDVFESLLKQQSGIEVSVETGLKHDLYVIRSDMTGVCRFVIPVGKVRIKAKLSGVHENEFMLFQTLNSGKTATDVKDPDYEFIDCTASQRSFALKLNKIDNLSNEMISMNLHDLLCQGNIELAKALREKLPTEKAMQVDELNRLLDDFKNLPPVAYNSTIFILEQMKGILENYCQDAAGLKIIVEGESINIKSRLSAVRRSRDGIITEYLELMGEAIEKNRQDLFLEEWTRFAEDPELNPGETAEWERLPGKIVEFREKVISVQGEMLEKMTTDFSDSVYLFDKGDLLTSRSGFTRLLRLIQNLDLQEEFPTMQGDIRNYLTDIALILSANEAIRETRYEEAYALLATVVHSNEIVHRRIEETQNFIHFQNSSSSGGAFD